MKKQETLSFEEAMKQLEEVVDKLGTGNLPLEEMVALYERGQGLSNHCMKLLEGFDARLDAVDAASNAMAQGEQNEV